MSNYAIHEEEYKGLTIKIEQDTDTDCCDPMDWDLLGKQVYWHRRMNLGHCWKETNKYSPEEWLQREVTANCWKHIEKLPTYKSWAKLQEKDGYNADVDTYIENEMSMQELWEAFKKYNLVIPVHAYEHGGITISASGRRAGWDSFDSGQLGFVYASHEDIKKNFMVKRLTKNILKKAEEVLIAEVSEYDDYLTGNVWGYIIGDESDDSLESCWGFLGDYKYCLEEARSAADYVTKKKEEELALFDKRMVGE